MKIFEIVVKAGGQVSTEMVLGAHMCFVHEYAEKAYVLPALETGAVVFLNITQQGVKRPSFLATSYGLEDSDCPEPGHCHGAWCSH